MIVTPMDYLCEKSTSGASVEDPDRNSGEANDSAPLSPALAAENGEEGGELDPPPYLPSPLLLQLSSPTPSEPSSHQYPLLPAGWQPAIDGSTWALPYIDNYPIPCAVKTQSDVFVPDITEYAEDVHMNGDVTSATPGACMFETSNGRTACFVVPASTPIAFLSSTDGRIVGYIHVRPVMFRRTTPLVGTSTEGRGDGHDDNGAPTFGFSLRYVGLGDDPQVSVFHTTVIKAPSLVPKPVYVSP